MLNALYHLLNAVLRDNQDFSHEHGDGYIPPELLGHLEAAKIELEKYLQRQIRHAIKEIKKG